MKFGRDFFSILNIVVQLMRMFAGIFGDAEDKKAVAESKLRSESADADEAC
ncbi:hypothetical protein ES705_45025 [subsurface metagenome]